MVAEFAVVGGGLLGLAAAYKLLRRFPDARLVVLEKEPAVGQHQSSHNSGVLHAGVSYAPGSAKARLAVGGIRQMVDFCRRLDLPYQLCGKLVVATEPAEVSALRTLSERGVQNGLAGLRWVEGPEITSFEPHAEGVAALHIPGEGIVDYPAVARALVRQIETMGGQVLTRARVHALSRERGKWRVGTERGDVSAGTLVNCAGLYADRIARLAGLDPGLRIIPFRGCYFALRAERRHLVRHLIYPVPDLRFPFLGVHLTRRMGGAVDAGPNAFLALAREGYRARDFSLRDTVELSAFPGLWRFLARHRKLVGRELTLTLSRARFAQALRRLVPELREEDLEPAGAGVRAQAMWANGDLVADFVFATSEGAVHLLNAPSPGATAALAIADEIVRRVTDIVPSGDRRLRTENPQTVSAG
jgi:L-2-hydroxyglutarate oxidase LhgO